MNKIVLLYFILFYSAARAAGSSFSFPNIDTPREIQKSAAEKLITRLVGSAKSSFFSVEIGGHANETDSFTLLKLRHDLGNIVRITGTSGVAVAYGFHFYLKNFCNSHVSWDYDQLSLPDSPSELPFVNVTVTSPDRFRYYQNVCTYSYSYAWWDWTRWEREIDWMALNGINLALAFTAQEVIWSRVYRKLNLTDRDIDEHFAGPAFLAWGRMANIRGWGGPLFENWHRDQLILQHKILRRMRSLGINPILPAFCGHVPRAFKRIFPHAKLTILFPWNHFPKKYCCPYLVEPDELLFAKVGELFYQTMKNEFGSAHFYNCDIFNELNPPNSSLTYLRNIASKVSAVLQTADSAAVWIMQGWLFASDAQFWTMKRIRHFLSGVSNDKMIVLDLQSELIPVYISTKFYFGKPFIWCMLHNFGGTLGMHGSLDTLNKNVIKARSFKNSTMVGSGMTPEGINQNYIMYDFMSEMGWRNSTVDMDLWIRNYSRRRYGVTNSNNLESAWILLYESVYNYRLLLPLHGQYTFIRRPSTQFSPWVWYNISDIATIWDLMLTTDDVSRKSLNYHYDLTDVTRQALQIVFDHLYIKLIASYNAKDKVMLTKYSNLLLDLLTDFDALLSTDRHFMLGPWIEKATLKGFTTNEKNILELNARYQITLWGPHGEILDYATKQWSGLVQDYYLLRWKLFAKYLYRSVIDRTPFEQRTFDTDVFTKVEQPFVLSQKKYPLLPQNETHSVSKYCYAKWSHYLKQTHHILNTTHGQMFLHVNKNLP